MAKYAAHLMYTKNDSKRLETRPVHRAYLKELFDVGKLHESGPFIDDSGALVIYNAESQAEAESMLKNDPFTKAGDIIEWFAVKEWKVVYPESETR